MKVKYAIFDLDNCLCNDAWRIPDIDWGSEDPDARYAAYHAKCGIDVPANIDVFGRVAARYTPIFLTARPTTVREQTLLWLKEHLGVKDPVLLMRNKGDHRHSVELKREQVGWLFHEQISVSDIAVAYDDRPDVVAMYRDLGIDAHVLAAHDVCAYTHPAQRERKTTKAPPLPVRAVTAGDVLGDMAKTFIERQGVYKDNYKMVAKLVAVLFPDGVPPELVVQDQWHLFELALVKLSRYAISGLTHIDSAHDGAVYLAMCEAINRNNLGETK